MQFRNETTKNSERSPKFYVSRYNRPKWVICDTILLDIIHLRSRTDFPEGARFILSLMAESRYALVNLRTNYCRTVTAEKAEFHQFSTRFHRPLNLPSSVPSSVSKNTVQTSFSINNNRNYRFLYVYFRHGVWIYVIFSKIGLPGTVILGIVQILIETSLLKLSLFLQNKKRLSKRHIT